MVVLRGVELVSIDFCTMEEKYSLWSRESGVVVDVYSEYAKMKEIRLVLERSVGLEQAAKLLPQAPLHRWTVP